VVAQGSNPRYNSVSLGASTAQPTTAAGMIRMPNNGTIMTTTTAGHCYTLKARDVDGASNTAMITICAGNTPTIDLAAGVTVGGNALLAVSDFGHDAILYFDNGSPDVANEVSIGSGLTFSGGSLSATMTPLHAMSFGAFGAGVVLGLRALVSRVRVRVRQKAWA